MKYQKKCPNCGSTSVRSRKSVYESGTSAYSGRSSTSGFSFGLFGKRKNPRFWFGGGSHSGQHQSLRAQSAAPLPIWPGVPVVFLIYIFLIPSFAVLFILLASWAAYAIYYNNKTYDKEWVCSQCGHFFNPAERFLNEITSEMEKVTSTETSMENIDDVIKRAEKINESFKEFEQFYKEEYGDAIKELKTSLDELSDSIFSITTVGEIEKLLLLVREDTVERKKNVSKILQLMDKLKEVGKEDIIKNYKTLDSQLRLVVKTADIYECLDKADKKLFLKDKKNEMRYLLEGLYNLKKLNVTSSEFDSLRARSEITGEVWTIDYIKRRLIDAGYTPEDDNLNI